MCAEFQIENIQTNMVCEATTARVGSGENDGLQITKIQTDNINLCAPDEVTSRECESLR